MSTSTPAGTVLLSPCQLKEESMKYFEGCVSYYFSDISSAANKYGFKMSL